MVNRAVAAAQYVNDAMAEPASQEGFDDAEVDDNDEQRDGKAFHRAVFMVPVSSTMHLTRALRLAERMVIHAAGNVKILNADAIRINLFCYSGLLSA